jgi:uncharacterized protein YkwD
LLHSDRLIRRCCWIVLALLLFGCQQRDVTIGSTRTPSSAEPPAPARVTAHPDFADTVITLVNHERTAAGCPGLTPNQTLIQVARAHSQDMAIHRFIEHTGSDGRSPAQRVQAAGYQYRIVAENVAAGRLTPESAVQGWMESPEHRANILNCALRDTGIGVVEVPDDPTYGIYWTQLFATPL